MSKARTLADLLSVGGAQGTAGTDGTDGVDGSDGTNGTNGAAGSDGTDGAAGNDGADGTNGVDGTNGADGTDGSDGTDGAAGTNGTDGTNGTNGTDGDSAFQIAVANGFTGTESDFTTESLLQGGQELTAGFTDRVSGTAGVSDIGNDVEYTQSMVDTGSWLRFGFNSARQTANDQPYWANSATNTDEAPHSGTTDYIGKGLFSGAYMPSGVNNMFSFNDNTAYNAASTSGALQYNDATGSYRMDELDVGDDCQFRFDFNLTPQFANTTVEVGLIWATRDSSNNVTYTFALTGEPLFYGAGTTGKTFLNRPVITAYLASDEDVNARALPAIRSDQPIFIQPLTTLFTVGR